MCVGLGCESQPLKRFTETTKWDDPWFWDLSPTAKLLWLFLCDHCDGAGIVEFSPKIAAAKLGQPVKEQHLAELSSRLHTLENGKLLIRHFIRFQYGSLSRDCKPHMAVFASLKRHNLEIDAFTWEVKGLPNPSMKGNGTLQDQEKEKDQEKDRKGKGFAKPTLEQVQVFCRGLDLPTSDADWFFHKCEGNGWTNDKKPILDWQATIRSWKAAKYIPSMKVPPGQARSKTSLIDQIGDEMIRSAKQL